MNLVTEIDRIAKPLPEWRRIAFCVGCAEHVEPLYRHLSRRTDARKALDLMWREVRGERVTEKEGIAAIARFRKRERSDPTLDARIEAAAGLAALSALNAGFGCSEGPTAEGAISAIWHADYLITPDQVHEDLYPWVRRHLTPAAKEELRLIRRMIRELKALPSDDIPERWIEKQKDRGGQVLAWFTAATLEGRRS